MTPKKIDWKHPSMALDWKEMEGANICAIHVFESSPDIWSVTAMIRDRDNHTYGAIIYEFPTLKEKA